MTLAQKLSNPENIVRHRVTFTNASLRRGIWHLAWLLQRFSSGLQIDSGESVDE